MPDSWDTDEQRAFDQRVADVFVIAAVGPGAEADPRGFERAVTVSRSSSSKRSELVHCSAPWRRAVQVRPSVTSDAGAIVGLSRRVQDRLTASGSLQLTGDNVWTHPGRFWSSIPRRMR